MKHALAAVSLCSMWAAPAIGQATGAFDMGVMTGTLAQDHVTQSEEERAGIDRTAEARAESAARARANCARLPALRARYGARDPRIVQIGQLCALRAIRDR